MAEGTLFFYAFLFMETPVSVMMDSVMNRNNIRLVVADIDMTLEYNMQGLPELNRKAIEELHREGILFALASGRGIAQLMKKASEWKLSFNPDLIIGVNGQALYDGLLQREDRLLLLEKEWVKEILDFLDAYGYDYHAYIDTYTLFRREDSHYYKVFKAVDRDIRLAGSRDDFLKGECFYKFILMDQDNDMEQLLKDIEPFLKEHKEHFKIVKTTGHTYEIVHASASKAYALQIFCERHGIDLQDVAAFGDADNDNEMIAVSGMGVCLKDGQECTKAVAKYITEKGCTEGGFGDFVFRHIL